jgi:hypothetical protein
MVIPEDIADQVPEAGSYVTMREKESIIDSFIKEKLSNLKESLLNPPVRVKKTL